jgi:alpha-L-fucosidase 2
MAQTTLIRDMKSTRRDLMVTAGLAMVFPGLAVAAVRSTTRGAQQALSLWYDRPAGPWVEALPVGNGRLGAMSFGRIAQERIQLNEDTLFAGGPYDSNNPRSLQALPQVRALIDQGRYADAAELIKSSMMATPMVQMPYGASGDLLLDFQGLSGMEAGGKPDSGSSSSSGSGAYRRWLDLDTAISSTRYTRGQIQYHRELFASVPDQVIVLRLTATGGTLDFDLGYRHPGEVNYGATDYTGAKGSAAAPVAPPWDYREPLRVEQRPASLAVRADGADALLVEGSNIASAGIPAALRYAVRVKVLGDGTITPRGDHVEVRGATAITLLIAAATSYVNFADVSGDPLQTVRKQTESAALKPYASLRTAHVQAHQAQFRKMSLRLGPPAHAGAVDARPTSQRIAMAETQDDPALAALYVQYGRYLLLSSSRPGSQPANLQGLWNEGINPPWGGKYTININTQMNYWPAESANIGVCVEPLLRMVEDLAVTGAVTARQGYGARGWMAHHNTDLWRAAAPIDGPLWGMWPCGGAWLCQALWDHYDYQRDPAWLRRIYPLLKGASLFFIDALVEDPKGRGLVTSPSISPENQHHEGVATCAGPAMDRQIIRDLFSWTLQAHALLKDSDQAFAAELQAKRARLPADRVGAHGQLQEWLDDWDADAPEQQHRHVSHLYGIYPSEQINVRDTPQLIAAAKVTLNTRGDKSTGWATAWRLALWTRMGEGERAYAILQGLLGPERTYPNMFDAHPPFQIDGNFGGTAAVLEMLMQSWGGEIRILPALPKAWPDGALHGVRARGGVELDLEWSRSRLTSLQLRGAPGQKLSVRYGQRLTEVVLDARGHHNFSV